MLILYFFGCLFSIKDDVKYYIETVKNPAKRLNVNKMTVRMTAKDIIQDSAIKVIDSVIFKKVTEDDYNVMFGESYLIKKDKEQSVIATEKMNESSMWKISEKPDGIFSFRMSDQCLQMMGIDLNTKGHYMHVQKCNDKDEQKFKIIEVPNQDTKSTDITPTNIDVKSEKPSPVDPVEQTPTIKNDIEPAPEISPINTDKGKNYNFKDDVDRDDIARNGSNKHEKFQNSETKSPKLMNPDSEYDYDTEFTDKDSDFAANEDKNLTTGVKENPDIFKEVCPLSKFA